MSLSQQAYRQIRHGIVSLKYPPRSVLDEAILREELGVGRTPIREALQQLAREELVTIIPRRGIFVADIELADLQRLFEMRVTLEKLAIQLACQRGKETHWQAMAECLKKAENNENIDSLIAIDQDCHEIIYQACDNRFLAQSLTMLYTLSLRLWYYALRDVKDMRGAVIEHQAMLDALQAADETASMQLMEGHIKGFQKEIQSAMYQKMAL